MIMIIAIIYIFLSHVIFDQQLKITFRKSSALPPPALENIHSLLFTHSPLKSLLLWSTLKIFHPPPQIFFVLIKATISQRQREKICLICFQQGTLLKVLTISQPNRLNLLTILRSFGPKF